ncbi:MAG TPA: RNA polymerase factor sigma-54 [Ktedonobacterales bacterium]|nr:RNA polymerase factor sigma-54 [Ktedonobacterales bacterium]
MSMDLNQTNQQIPIRVASPQLVAANHILALSSAELQSFIYQEMSENPALDMEETPVCPQCGRPLQGQVCQVCQQRLQNDLAKSRQEASDYDDGSGWQAPLRNNDDDEFDPTTRVAAQMSLAEHLTLSLQAQFPQEDGPLIEYLVGNLDEDGRLRCDVDEVVDIFDVEEEHVEEVIRTLQTMEPVGVGARNLRECLLIQLDYVEAQGQRQPFAREVISRFLTELSEHKYGQIALALGATTEMIHSVSDFIRRNLNPFPGRGHLDANLSGGGETATPVLPDVIISKKLLPNGKTTYEVEIVESKRYYLRINPSYSQVYQQVSARQMYMSEDERRHIQQYVTRARLFIANINQRRQTLGKITRCIVDLQREFLDKGVRYLKPLTRARVAGELDMHESTVSRATAAKYVMLPNGEVIPFSNFFVANLSVKDVIKDLVDHERDPLTDQDLAQLLSDRGIPVARRTVAKYREQLGILPSTLR